MLAALLSAGTVVVIAIWSGIAAYGIKYPKSYDVIGGHIGRLFVFVGCTLEAYLYGLGDGAIRLHEAGVIEIADIAKTSIHDWRLYGGIIALVCLATSLWVAIVGLISVHTHAHDSRE